MVEYNLSLDSIFGSLADPTRRDILERVSHDELSVNDIALPYDISLAAVSKHLKILEKAKLIVKRKRGKQHFVTASPTAFKDANDYLQKYEAIWNQRFESLEALLNEGE